jgi:hypothetical protein
MRANHVRHFIGVLLISAAAASAGAVASPPAVATSSSAARSCKPPDYPGSGYFTSLSVKNTSCAKGGALAVAYYRCRTENGKAGRCKRKVNGYRCTEKRNAIATEIDALVRCRRGAKRVTHTYQQNL